VELEPLLLVVGNRSHGVLDAILGCVARDVARWSPLPTLVLPDAAGDDAFERSLPLLCGVDDSAPSERAADFAAGLARVLDVELVLLSVVDARTTALPTAPAAMPVVVEPPELLERQQAAVREHAEHLAARLGARAMVEIGEPAGQNRPRRPRAGCRPARRWHAPSHGACGGPHGVCVSGADVRPAPSADRPVISSSRVRTRRSRC
jgi:nucleotide-binding universal stress UspA family protein